jgi:poly-gamma-glutamate synthesis protein (capsule biosynthesis protein)
MKHRLQTVDGGFHHRPRSIGFMRAFAICILITIVSACQPKALTVSLALLGDLMLGRGVNPQPDFLAYLMPELAKADLALANLESPLANVIPATDSTYNLCVLSSRAELLSTWGIDLLSLANNHSLDCGPDGPAETRAALQSAGITSIGPSMLPVYREVNGLQLAFLAFDDESSSLDADTAIQAIHSARSTGALVVVSIHWGAEYQGGAIDRQKSLAGQFAQAGATLIWGHHPHVLQPAAWIETAQGKTLVLYSLGNALFDQGGLQDTRQSALVMVTMDAGGVASVRSVPFEIDVEDSRVVQPDAETAAKIRDRLYLP